MVTAVPSSHLSSSWNSCYFVSSSCSSTHPHLPTSCLHGVPTSAHHLSHSHVSTAAPQSPIGLCLNTSSAGFANTKPAEDKVWWNFSREVFGFPHTPTQFSACYSPRDMDMTASPVACITYRYTY